MNNQIKTVLLLGLLTGILLGIGSYWGYSGLIIGLVFAVCINFGSYFFSDKIVLRMYKAKEADEKDYPALYRVVRDVVHLAHVPMPKVYVIKSDNLNAFATGRNPEHAVVACTEGIIKVLSKDELKGVLAHECGHVKNRDILISTIATTIATVIGYLAMMAKWSAIFGIGGRDRNNNLFGLLAVAIITPIIAMIIQMAISRSREYLADYAGAKVVGSGESLARALEKLESHNKAHPMRFGSTSTAHLFISNPFGKISSLLSTHPKTSERCRKLREMTF